MRYRRICAVLPETSALCLGTAEMGTVMDEADSFKMLDAFWEQGGNFLDTAHEYGDMACDEKSMSEKTIGRWMKSRNNRKQMLIATKGGMPYIHSRHIPRLSRAEIISDLEGSLACMGVNEADLFYLHRDDPARDVEEIIDVMDGLVKSGKIRTYGLANWKLDRYRRACAYARENQKAVPAASQLLWSLAKVNMDAVGDNTIAAMDEETWRYCFQSGTVVAPYTSQARGFFEKLAKGDASGLQDWVRASYYMPENLARLERVKKASRCLGYSVPAIVLSYLTTQPFITIPVFSSRNLSQLKQSMAAGDIVLPEGWGEYLCRGGKRPGSG